MNVQLSLTLWIFSTTIVCVIFERTVLANTEILEIVHPLAYSSICNFSSTEVTRIVAVEAAESQTCFEHSQEDEMEYRLSWLVGLWVGFGAIVSRITRVYAESLDSSPVMTKSVTSALMGALGDIFAQAMEIWTNGGSWDRKHLNLRRMCSIAAEGLFVSGPLMHYSYEFLERHLPIFSEENTGNDLHSWYMTICQVIVDMIVMDSVFVATMMITSALLEGRRQEIRHEMATAYVPAVKVSWFNSFCWAPVQCISFKYIPFNYRVLAINLQDIAWNASVSYMAHRSRHGNVEEDPDDKILDKARGISTTIAH